MDEVGIGGLQTSGTHFERDLPAMLSCVHDSFFLLHGNRLRCDILHSDDTMAVR
jgi:hypothetical protein